MKEIVRIIEDFMEGFDEVLEKDMLNIYFFLLEFDYEKVVEEFLFESIKRVLLLSDDIMFFEFFDGDEDIYEEKMNMWYWEIEVLLKSFF